MSQDPDAPISSPTLVAPHTGAREQGHQSSTSDEHGASARPGMPPRCNSQPLLFSSLSQLNEHQPAPPRPSSPAYLQGKNPYGRILDNDHPYRNPQPTPMASPLTVDNKNGDKPTVSEPLAISTQAVPSSTGPKSHVPLNVSTGSAPLSGQTGKTPCVQNVKSFFESMAHSSTKPPPTSPLSQVAAISKGTTTAESIDPVPGIPSQELNDTKPLCILVSSPETPVTIHEKPGPSAGLPLEVTESTATLSSDAVDPESFVETAKDTSSDRDSPSPPRYQPPGRSGELITESLPSPPVDETRICSTNVSVEPQRAARPDDYMTDTVVQSTRLEDLLDAAHAAIQMSKNSQPILGSGRPVRKHILKLYSHC